MRNTIQHILILTVLVIFADRVSAQDPQYSQYFASPLTLNPAITGNIDGQLRIAANYRQQWWGTGSPFNTGTVSFEHRLLENKLGTNDRFGIGGLMMVDNSLSGALRSTYMSVSSSFHKGLGEFHRLGIGFQGTYGNRVIDYSRLSFFNQFDTEDFNTNLPSGETVLATIKPTLSISTGLMYTYEDDLKRVYAGGSLYHLNKPSQTAIQDSLSRIPTRFTFHTGALLLTGSSIRVSIHGLYQQQAKATSVSAGGALGYDLDEQNTVYAGAWYRFGDAAYPYISYSRNGMQLALSYDVTMSSAKTLRRNASMELSFIYNKPNNSFEKRAMPWNY